MKSAKTYFLTAIFVTLPVAIGLITVGIASTDSVKTSHVNRTLAALIGATRARTFTAVPAPFEPRSPNLKQPTFPQARSLAI